VARGGGAIGTSLTQTVSKSTTTLVSSGSTNTLSTLTTNINHGGHGGSGKKGKRRSASAGIDVYVRVFPHDSLEPGLKVARVTSEATLKVNITMQKFLKSSFSFKAYFKASFFNFSHIFKKLNSTAEMNQC